LCDEACCSGETHLGKAQVIGMPVIGGHIDVRAVLDLLADAGLTRVFVEGGGVTVSRFLAAGCLDRLQITVAPLILGSGRPSITLPEIDAIGAALTPVVRRFSLGRDILFECCFDG
jgi:riboflavin biosynthesis pyrimidine reductase